MEPQNGRVLVVECTRCLMHVNIWPYPKLRLKEHGFVRVNWARTKSWTFHLVSGIRITRQILDSTELVTPYYPRACC